MTKAEFLAHAAAFAPRLFQVRRTTWIAFGIGLLMLSGLLLWAVLALIGGLWGQAQSLAGAAPDALRGATRMVKEQVELAMPGAREKLGEYAPALKMEPPRRDVSGTDIGPVARYPGLARSYWHREGREITVRHEGPADYAAVLDYYVKAFAARGYRQNLLSATPDGEQHDYIKDSDRVGFALMRMPKGGVKVTTVTFQP